jgi:hypothetical protein
VNVQLKLLKLYITATMRYLATLLVTLLLAVPAISVELFRYRYRAEDGGEFEYICEADEQNVPKTVSEEKAAEIAADWVTVFYHVQAGVIESQEFLTSPISHWLFCFSDTLQGSMQRMLSSYCFPTGWLFSRKSRNGFNCRSGFPRRG